LYILFNDSLSTIDQADTDDKKENNETPPSSKGIVEALNVPRSAVHYRVDEKGFE